MIARKLGYEIIICENGQLVLDTLEAEAKKGKNKEIELVLMDASMVRQSERQHRCVACACNKRKYGFPLL
jgi:hypothetical protein